MSFLTNTVYDYSEFLSSFCTDHLYEAGVASGSYWTGSSYTYICTVFGFYVSSTTDMNVYYQGYSYTDNPGYVSLTVASAGIWKPVAAKKY